MKGIYFPMVTHLLSLWCRAQWFLTFSILKPFYVNSYVFGIIRSDAGPTQAHQPIPGPFPELYTTPEQMSPGRSDQKSPGPTQPNVKPFKLFLPGLGLKPGPWWRVYIHTCALLRYRLYWVFTCHLFTELFTSAVWLGCQYLPGCSVWSWQLVCMPTDIHDDLLHSRVHCVLPEPCVIANLDPCIHTLKHSRDLVRAVLQTL